MGVVMAETIKAGCYLIDIETKCVALVFRERDKDFSFPKGHLEPGETIEDCAIRETAEETKRIAKVVEEYEPFVERYVTPKGEKCVVYMYIAIDMGHSNNDSTETHDTYWIPFEEVEGKLSYESLKDSWRQVKNDVYAVMVAKKRIARK